MQHKEHKYNINKSALEINVGSLLKDYFVQHRTRKAALARALNRSKNSVLGYQKNKSIQVAILWEISVVLKHNFFLDIASKLPTDFSTYAPIDIFLEEKIKTLEMKLQLAEAERDVLIKAMK